VDLGLPVQLNTCDLERNEHVRQETLCTIIQNHDEQYTIECLLEVKKKWHIPMKIIQKVQLIYEHTVTRPKLIELSNNESAIRLHKRTVLNW